MYDVSNTRERQPQPDPGPPAFEASDAADRRQSRRAGGLSRVLLFRFAGRRIAEMEVATDPARMTIAVLDARRKAGCSPRPDGAVRRCVRLTLSRNG
jgi:hypothetical protein